MDQGNENRRSSAKVRQKKPLLLIRFFSQTSLSPSDLYTLGGQPGTKGFVFGILFKERHQSHNLFGHHGVILPKMD